MHPSVTRPIVRQWNAGLNNWLNVGRFSKVLKLDFSEEHVNIDGWTLYMCSILSPILLMMGTAFLLMDNYFGDKLECLSNKAENLPPNLLEHYCWLEGLFTVSDNERGDSGYQVAYPGVKPYEPHRGERKINHKYYQWTYFALSFQSLLFYVPKLLWKRKRQKLVQTISELKSISSTGRSLSDRRDLVDDVMDVIDSDHLFWVYFALKILCLIVILIQYWLTDVILNQNFWLLGYDWIKYSNSKLDSKYDPLIRVFPRLSKCTFHKYGYSGTIETQDALCFLPWNVIIEKIYLVFWFWIWLLLIVTVVDIFWTFGLCFPCFRKIKAHWKNKRFEKHSRKYMTSTVDRFFVLSSVAAHMRSTAFKQFIDYAENNPKPSFEPGLQAQKETNRAISQPGNKSKKNPRSKQQSMKPEVHIAESTSPSAPGFRDNVIWGEDETQLVSNGVVHLPSN